MISLNIKAIRLLSLFMTILIVLSCIPANIVKASYQDFFTDDDFTFTYTLEDGSKATGNGYNGYKNLPYTTSIINIDLDGEDDSSFVPVKEDSLKGIRVTANGEYDETYRFNISYDNNVLRLEAKGGYKLLKHTLYVVDIPKNTFKIDGGSDRNRAEYFSFVTSSGNTGLDNNIIKKATVGSDADKNVLINDDANRRGLRYENGKIILEFVDDIEFNSWVVGKLNEYIYICSSPIDSDIPSYNSVYPRNEAQTIDDFKVYISGNKLIFEAKHGKLKDFAEYNIYLENNVVFLKNSNYGSGHDTKVGNEACSIEFKTDNMLTRTTPQNNEENVEVEPVIEFLFKYPIDISKLDKTKISITGDGSVFNIDDLDIFLSAVTSTDNKTLILNVNDKEGNKVYPFRSSTLYTITLEAGAVTFKDYAVSNSRIQLSFITSSDGKAPVITGYSSNADNTDDIRYLNHEDKKVVLPEDKVTNLDADGKIYIHFDRRIRADKQTEFLSLLEATHLYKIPKADEIRFDENGKLLDEAISYVPYTYTGADGELDTIIIPGAIQDPDFLFDASGSEALQEIQIYSVEIISPNILAVKPKQKLDNMAKYKITVDKRVIEDYNGYNIESDIDFMFWTKAGGKNTAPSWKRPEDIEASSITENKEAPFKSYTISGAPRYSADKPIILELDGEVIVRAKDAIVKETPDDPKNERRISFDALKDICLEDVYNTEPDNKKVKINKYQIRYEYEGSKVKTKLYLYPCEGTNEALGYGRYYRLSIPEGVLTSRSGSKVPKLEVNFITEADASKAFGIYQLKDNSIPVTQIWEKGEGNFKILGYNFHEYDINAYYTIKSIELYDSINSRIIVIDSKDIEFVNVTELNVRIRGTNAELLSTESYTGQYEISCIYTSPSGDMREQLVSGTSCERDMVVEGKDFRSDIKSVTLKNSSTSEQVIISSEFVEYLSDSKIVLKLRGSNAVITSGWGSAASYEVLIEYEKKIELSRINDKWVYELYGQGFANPVYQVIFRPVLGNAMSLHEEDRDIVVNPGDISTESNTKLKAALNKDNLDKLKDPLRAGTYCTIVKFTSDQGLSDIKGTAQIVVEENGDVTISETVNVTDPLTTKSEISVPNRFVFELISKGKPKVKEKYPYPSNTGKWTDEKSLLHNVNDTVTSGKYFVKVTFEDIDGKLDFNYSTGLSLLKDASFVMGQGSSDSMIDNSFLSTLIALSADEREDMIDKYIFVKNRAKREACLYIPILSLQAALSYDVSISASVLSNDANGGTSNAIVWKFMTMGKPVIKTITAGSIAEDYGSGQTVAISGNYFHASSIKVFFNSIEAPKVTVKVEEDGQQHLEAYLPTGDSRLKPGVYSIAVKNDVNHDRVSYGSLSIVKKGEYAPGSDEGHKGKSENGEITYDYNISEDTLELNSMYSGTDKITLKLDEIMGEEVWTRKIKLRGNTRQTIAKLKTLSRWADITLYDLTLDPEAENRDMVIKLGRVEAALVQTLKSKLGSRVIKSDMIQVTGESFTVSQIDIAIPFENSDGSSLKVMRYDEASRSWVSESGSVDQKEKLVRFTAYKTGIFAVVE